ncbi:MAG TPA: hypothetical protein PLZ86_02900 [bacterium]|nr:hypothetical protein [bacterium]
MGDPRIGNSTARPAAGEGVLQDDAEALLPFFATGGFPWKGSVADGGRREQCLALERLIEKSRDFVASAPYVSGAVDSLAGITLFSGIVADRFDAVDDGRPIYAGSGAIFLAARGVDLHARFIRKNIDVYARWYHAMSCSEILHPSPFEEAARKFDSMERSAVDSAAPAFSFSLASLAGAAVAFLVAGAAFLVTSPLSALASLPAAILQNGDDAFKRDEEKSL